VVRVDQATTVPLGALTVGAVPQLLNVVLKVKVVPPAETVDVYVMGRSELEAMSSVPVPAGTRALAGTTPVIFVAAAPPGPVTLADDSAVSGISPA
jgi:hypothetical protein